MRKVFLCQLLVLTVSILCGYAVVLTVSPGLYEKGFGAVTENGGTAALFLAAFALYFAAIHIWLGRPQAGNAKTPRESNIELCRVVCMLGIIAHHLVVHGGILGVETMTPNKTLSYLALPWGKIGFDCFVAVSCWFLADREFQAGRFWKIWLTVLFYSVLFAVVSFLMGTPMTAGNWFSVCLPIAGNSHGFAASYLAFYLLLPFLNRMTRGLTKKQARMLLWLFLYLETGTQIIGYFTNYYQKMPSEIFVFIVCYLIALNLKRWPVGIMGKPKACLFLSASVWFVIGTANYWFALHPENKAVRFLVSTMGDESSVSNIVAGFALFFFFAHVKVKPLPVIRRLAAGTFGILLIHDHNFFRYPLWEKIVKCRLWYDRKGFVILAAVFVVWIFVSAFAIDAVRNTFFEKYVLNSRIFRNVCGRHDGILAGETRVTEADGEKSQSRDGR